MLSEFKNTHAVIWDLLLRASTMRRQRLREVRGIYSAEQLSKQSCLFGKEQFSGGGE